MYLLISWKKIKEKYKNYDFNQYAMFQINLYIQNLLTATKLLIIQNW